MDKKNTIWAYLLIFFALLLLATPAIAATTTVHIARYANDGTTVLNQTNVTYQWMRDTLPVLGDGVTHYYHQGPVFIDDNNETLEQELRWNPQENSNILEKDMGAVKGTNLKDLCDLVGGMSPGEQAKILSSDGFSKWVAYDNVYGYSPREGPIGLTWYMNGNYPDSGYSDGMRLVWFADDSVNTLGPGGAGVHAFGNWDWHEAAAPEYWYYYVQGSENYPTTTGLSAKYVNRIYIYSNESPPLAPVAAFMADVTSGTAPLTVQLTDQSSGISPLTYAWDFDNDGTVDSAEQSPSHTYNAAGTYTVNLTVTNSVGSDDEVKTDYITVTPLPPSIKVESPNGGETWSLGSTQSIKWNYTENPGPSVKIEALRGETVIATIPSVSIGSGGSGFYNLTIPSSTPLGDNYRFRVTSTSNPAYNDVSDAPFTIGAPITVVSPDGGEAWQLGSAQAVQWTYTGNPGSSVKIEALRGETVIATIPSVSIGSGGSGFFNLTVPFSTPLGDNYRFRVTSTSNPAYTDTSNAPFTISADSGSSITIVSPNGGEIWTQGSTQFINWTYAGTPGSMVKIEFLKGSTVLKTVTDISTSSGSVSIPVPYRTPFGDDYKVRITSTSNPAYTDTSAAPFTIASAITVVSPNGGEIWPPGSTHPLQWTYLGNPGSAVKIEALRGDTVLAVISSSHPIGSAGAGSFNLTFPNSTPLGDDYRIRVTSTTYPACTDTSNGFFSVGTPPTIDVLFNGTVALTPGATFAVTTYNSGANYTVNRTTPLGALDVAATTAGFTYDMSDKNYGSSGALLLDNISTYVYRKTPRKAWYAYLNDVYKDGYNNPAGALNLIPLNDGDRVEFYYVDGTVSDPSNLAAVKANASAAVMTIADTTPGPVMDVLFNGTVALTPGATFTVTAYNSGANYTVNRTTPLGALDVAATTAGFTYDISDKNYGSSGALLLDNIITYVYQKTPRKAWYAYLNDVYKDGFNNPAGALNLIALNDGDRVEFYYVDGTVSDPSNLAAVKANASAAVKTIASTGETPTDWSIALDGAMTMTVSKAYFEQGLACPSSGHMVNYTDAEGDVWGGVPLWLLVAMVDDNPDEGPDHYNFNDALAAEGYSVKVTAGDGYSINFESIDIARNNDYIVANTLNGEPLPLLRPNSTKPCFPLQMIGPEVDSGKLVGNIKSIELVGLPEPPAGWTLSMEGDVVDIITQQYFEEGIVCHHNTTYTDGSGNVWNGVALWELVGAVDDIETTSHWTFNDTRASAGYTIRVIAVDGFNRTFASGDVARSSNYIVANKKNGELLNETEAPLRLVGANATGGKSVGKISAIRLEGLPAYPPGNWSLLLDGAISDIIPQPEFEDWAACHPATYTDGTGNVYEGIPLWRLMGWIDDRIPHGSNGFNNALAIAGYKVIVTAGDGYSKEFTSQEIGTTNNFIVANKMNGLPLSADGEHPPYPLRLVGAGLPSIHYSVGNVVKIELTDFQEPTEIPNITIIKYASDEVTIINQTTVDYVWMESHLPVIGDGVTHYQYQGLTLDPDDLWDPNETKGMTPPKIDNAIKGTKVLDLCNLVGGMEPGTEVTFVAVDNWETTLPYDCIYPNPHVYSHLGDTIIAWYADGQYVPNYSDGPRLFFTPEDHVTGQWNMHEALPEEYWHYNYQDGINYPSVAGLSAKYIKTIKIYASPVTDWTLVLDGEEIGGLKQNISRNYFESALSCQFGANHEVEYTDSQGRTWAGMPLWFLAGFVDDHDQHSENAFNDTLAAAGYDVIVTAGDGTFTTIPSDQIIRNNNYLVANTLNGTRIPETDPSWPLRLVGQNVTGAMSVKGIASIELFPSGIGPTAPIANFTADVTSGDAPLTVNFTDQSTNMPTSWAWDVDNDGTVDYATQNATHTYATAGTYTVNLTVTNAGGSDSEVKTDYITVTSAGLQTGYASYLGGTGAEYGYATVADDAGNVYVTGRTNSADFPTTTGAYQTTYGGGDFDAFVVKIDSNGNLIYSTYLGGTGNDIGYAIAADSSGNAYIAGSTTSSNFPTTEGAYNRTLSGTQDGFVVKLNPSGTSLLYSTYLGGATVKYSAQGQEEIDGITIGSSGKVYITGRTGASDFPVTTGAYNTTMPYTNGGSLFGFISVINPAGSGTGDLVYSTYLGGDMGTHYSRAIVLDSVGRIYVAGQTTSDAFPVTSGALQTTKPCAGDNYNGFMSKINPAGSGTDDLVYSTYLGGTTGPTYARGIGVDSAGMVYLTGYTTGTDLPTTTGAYQTTNAGDNDAFVCVINPAGSGTGDLVYSTYFGGTGVEYGYGSALDSSGTVYLTGSTYSSDFPTTIDAFQASLSGTRDAFVTKLNPKGSGTDDLVYSTYFGGTGAESGYAVALNSADNAYVAGLTSSTDFPVTTGAYQATYGGGSYDAFVAKFVFASAPIPPAAEFDGSPTSGDAPLTVQFTDQSTNTPDSWAWDVDNDGTVDYPTQNATHTYATAGTFTVNLTVTNAGGSDSEVKTDYITVTEAVLPVLNVNTGLRYASIQAAITAATTGDEILVSDGSYTENVVIDKSITIRSENGAAVTTVTAANSLVPVFDVNAADFVTINGFSVRGATGSNIGGIDFTDSDSGTITNNDVANGYNGIHLGGTSTNNTISYNNCHDNSKRGLSMRNDAYGNYAFRNTFSANADKDICIKDMTHDNVVWLNNLLGGTLDIGTANTENSTVPITYTYNGSSYTSYLGNYYSTYAGTDADGNGVGDTGFTSGAYWADDYPLMAQSVNYV